MVRATLVIMVLTLLSKIFGFVREMVIAYRFGASAAVDAYLVAYTIPYLLMAMIGGALATVVIPVYSELVAGGRRQEAWRALSSFAVVVTLLLSLITLAAAIRPDVIVQLLAPGLPDDAGRLAADLTLIMLPSVVLLALTNLATGVLQANRIFAPPALTGVINNLFIIGGAVGGTIWGVYGLAVGTMLGIAVSFAFQLPYLKKVGFNFYPVIDWHDPIVQKCFKLLLPMMIGMGINQVYLIIDRVLASWLEEGSIAALNYASKVVLLNQGVFVLAISTSIYPTLAALAAEKRWEEMRDTLERGLRMTTFFAVPAGITMLLLAEPMVRLLFQRGAFDERAVAFTAGALFFFALGILGQCLNPILTRAFFALHDTRTPVYVDAVTVAVNLIFSLLLVKFMQLSGLALANSLAANFNIIALFLLLRRRINLSISPGLTGWVVKMIVCNAAMAVIIWLVIKLTAGWAVGFWRYALQFFLASLAGTATYAVLSLWTGLPEAVYLYRMAIDTGRRLLVRSYS